MNMIAGSPSVETIAPGWALLHFLWQGAALAAAAGVAMAVSRGARARYLIGLVALSAMVLAPVLTYALYELPRSNAVQVAGGPRGAEVDPFAARSPGGKVDWKTAGAEGGGEGLPWSAMRGAAEDPRAFSWLVALWLSGVAVSSLRSAGGQLWIARLRRASTEPLTKDLQAACRTLQRTLGVRRRVRFARTTTLAAPVVLGWLRPLVLLPATVLTGLSAQQIRLVVAHELAHIKRFDGLVNLLQVAVETLLFYHPAVWWLNRRIRAERENCCDDLVVAACGGAVEYARALAQMEGWRSAPRLAMAANAGSLRARVVRILGISPVDSAPRQLKLAGSLLCLVLALAVGGALFAQPAAEDSRMAGGVAGEVGSERSSFMREVRALGFEPDVDGLVAMRVHQVTPAFVRELRGAGLEVGDYRQAIALKIHGATVDFVRELAAQGLVPDSEQLIAMLVHDVSLELVTAARALGVEVGVDEIIEMKVHGVTPEFIARARAAGFYDLDPSQLAQLKRLAVLEM